MSPTGVIVTFLPLLVLIVIIVGLIMLISRKKIIPGKKYTKIGWMFTAYVAILLLSVAAFFLTPDKHADSGEKYSVDKAVQEGQQFYEDISNGRLENIDDAYKKKTWTFDYAGDQLDLKTLVNDTGTQTRIFIQRKGTEDNKVEAVFYQTPKSSVGKKIKIPGHPSLTLTDHLLLIGKREQTNLKFTIFKEAFPFTQFNGKEGEKNPISMSSASGNAVLYLRIPQNLELNAGGSVSVEYVHDE